MVRKTRTPEPDPVELTARIVSVSQNYHISRSNGRAGTFVDDEAAVEIEAVIETISKRHRKLLGEPISISLLHAVRYKGEKEDISPFFGSVTLRGGQKSVLAYIPAEPFWRVPEMVERGANMVEAHFSPTRHGFGELLSFFVGSEAEFERIARLVEQVRQPRTRQQRHQ